MAEHSPGPFMKMSPSGFPGLLVVLFVVFTSCAFFGVQFLWVLLGLGALGIGLAALFCFVHSRRPKDVGLSLESHGAPPSTRRFAFDAAEKNGTVEELHSQLVELAKAQNQSKNGGTYIPATFLRITVSV